MLWPYKSNHAVFTINIKTHLGEKGKWVQLCKQISAPKLMILFYVQKIIPYKHEAKGKVWVLSEEVMGMPA